MGLVSAFGAAPMKYPTYCSRCCATRQFVNNADGVESCPICGFDNTDESFADLNG